MLKYLGSLWAIFILPINAAHADWTLFKPKPRPPLVATTCSTALAEYHPQTDDQADLFFRQLRLLEETDEQGQLSAISEWIQLQKPYLPFDPFDSWGRFEFLTARRDLIIGELHRSQELGFLVARVPSSVTFQTRMPDGHQGGHPVHALVWTPGGFKIALSDADFGVITFTKELDPFLLKPFALNIAQVKSILARKAKSLN